MTRDQALDVDGERVHDPKALVERGRGQGPDAHLATMKIVLFPLRDGHHVEVVTDQVLTTRRRRARSDHSHGHAGEAERLCQFTNGPGIPLGQERRYALEGLARRSDELQRKGGVEQGG